MAGHARPILALVPLALAALSPALASADEASPLATYEGITGLCRVGSPVTSVTVTSGSDDGRSPYGCEARALFTFEAAAAECTPSACILDVGVEASGSWWMGREDANVLAANPNGGIFGSWTDLRASVHSFGDAYSSASLCSAFEEGFDATCAHERPFAVHLSPGDCTFVAPALEIHGLVPAGAFHVQAFHDAWGKGEPFLCRAADGTPSFRPPPEV